MISAHSIDVIPSARSSYYCNNVYLYNKKDFCVLLLTAILFSPTCFRGMEKCNTLNNVTESILPLCLYILTISIFFMYEYVRGSASLISVTGSSSRPTRDFQKDGDRSRPIGMSARIVIPSSWNIFKIIWRVNFQALITTAYPSFLSIKPDIWLFVWRFL